MPVDNGPLADDVGVVVAIPAPSAAASGLTVETIEAIQATLAGKDRAYDQRARDWAGFDVAPILNLNPEDKSEKARIRHVRGDLLQSGLLVRGEAYDKPAGRPRPVIRVGEPAHPPQSPDASVDDCGSVDA